VIRPPLLDDESMSLLAQQELVEVPPRRMVVPAGHTAWWGVDPSTQRIAVAGVATRYDGSLDRWVGCRPFRPSAGPQRLSEVYRVTRDYVVSMATCCPWPGVVFIEQPSGKFENPELSYAVGVTIAAVFNALATETGVPPHIETVTSSSWKKRACGRGNLYKPTKEKLGRAPTFEDYPVAVWARENGYQGSSFDECDAWGIAEAARRTVALEVR
jgi:hypothetical protein